MKVRTFNVGDTVRLAPFYPARYNESLSGLVVRKIVTETTETEIYELLLSDGRLVAKTAEQLRYVVIRQDGVEVNV